MTIVLLSLLCTPVIGGIAVGVRQARWGRATRTETHDHPR